MSPESEPVNEAVNRELDLMEQRLRMWTESYLQWAGDDAANAAREYRREVEEIFLPYLSRLQDEGEISPAQFSRFSSFLEEQIQEIRTAKGSGG